MELTQFEKTGTNEAKLTVKVTEEEFNRAVDAAIRIKGKKLSVPGFRKGKAPKALLEKTYGREYFYQDAVNETYGTAYDMAVEKANIVPVDRADIELVECSDKGYTFTATVTVKPEVKVKDYKGIKVSKNIKTISDVEVDADLGRMLQRNARMITVEGRAAENGDIAEIDYEGFKDGVAFDGGKGEHYDLELGSGSFIPGFEDQVCGHNVDDEFDVNVSFPEDYPSEDLKGAAVVFKCKLYAIKHKELPTLDDDFAKDVSEFDTLKELRENIRKKLQKKADEETDREVEEQIVDVLVANTVAEIPDCMYEARIEDMASDFERRLAGSGLTLDEYLKYSGANKEDFLAGFKPQAERQVKIRLALEYIVEAEKISIDKEEMDEKFKSLAELYEMKEEQVRQIVPETDLALDLCVEKAIKFVREKAEVVEGDVEAPKKKTATKKKKEDVPVETVAEEAPKKKTTTRKKKEEAPVEDVVEEAPKKKAAPKKKKEDASVEATPATKEAPKKTTRKKKEELNMDID